MREQELEVVKTAYFLEDQIVHQTQELQRRFAEACAVEAMDESFFGGIGFNDYCIVAGVDFSGYVGHYSFSGGSRIWSGRVF